jgi:hypothetical protein
MIDTHQCFKFNEVWGSLRKSLNTMNILIILKLPRVMGKLRQLRKFG